MIYLLFTINQSINHRLIATWQVWSPTTRYQLHGITREATLQLARTAGLTVIEKDFTLCEVQWCLPANTSRAVYDVHQLSQVDL